MTGRGISSSKSRGFFVEFAPMAFFVGAIWVKLSYFNLPPAHPLLNDWYPWEPGQAAVAALGSLATLLLAVFPLFFIAPVGRFAFFWLLDLVLSLIVLANAIHFRYFSDVISALELLAAWQVGLVYRSVIRLLQPTDILFFADLAVALAGFRWYRRQVRKAPRYDGWARRVLPAGALAAGLCLAAIPVWIVVNDGGGDGVLFYDHFRYFGVRRIGLLNAGLYEAGQVFYSRVLAPRGVTAADRLRVEQFLEEWRREAPPSPLFGAARNRNVILLLVESLHAFPVGLRIEGQELTPNLNALAGRSLVFENFYDQTWEGGTADGEFLSLQSLHPLPSGAVQTLFPINYYRALPSVAAERGYSTLSAHAYYSSLWKMGQMHPRLGFQQSFFGETYPLTERIGLGLSDREYFRQTIPRLVAARRPWMALLMTLTMHHPYDLPDRYKTLKLGGLEGSEVGDYLHVVHYFDDALGEFLRLLEQANLLDDSVLVVYGDHSARLGEEDGQDRPAYEVIADLVEGSDRLRVEQGFNYRVWREKYRLPLIIHLPHDAGAGFRSVSGGLLDIAPTVLGLLGISDHRMVTLGRDLTGGNNSLVVFRDGSFVEGDTLCVLSEKRSAPAECRNRLTGEVLDPGRFQAQFEAARRRLEISDLIITGNLIPKP